METETAMDTIADDAAQIGQMPRFADGSVNLQELFRSLAERIAEALGVARLSKDQVSAIAQSLDADVAELLGRPLGGLDTPYLWLDATYVKCRREGRVASTAVVTAIGCDREGCRRVLGVSVVDTESEGSWASFLRGIKSRGVRGVRLVVSDACQGLVGAIAPTFQGAAWQRCAVHLMRDCMRGCPSRGARKRVGRILSTVFRAKDPDLCRAMRHAAAGMVAAVSTRAARVLEEAECDALAYPGFPASHWKRLRTDNVQERCNREIKRRTRVVQVFPSVKSLERLAGAVMCEVDELCDGHRPGRAAAESAAKDMDKVREDAKGRGRPTRRR